MLTFSYNLLYKFPPSLASLNRFDFATRNIDVIKMICHVFIIQIHCTNPYCCRDTFVLEGTWYRSPLRYYSRLNVIDPTLGK